MNSGETFELGTSENQIASYLDSNCEQYNKYDLIVSVFSINRWLKTLTVTLN